MGENAGTNQYDYVGNSPINSTDPLGLFDVSGALTRLDIYASLNGFAADGYGRGGFVGGAQAFIGNMYTGYVDMVGGDTVGKLATKSGGASGCGHNVTAAIYGTATVGLIALNAFTWMAPKGAVLNAGAWLKNPYLYEVGSLTLPYAIFKDFAKHAPVARGAALLAKYGGLRQLYRQAASKSTLADWMATLAQGPTTGGLLGTLGINQFAPSVIDYYMEWTTGEHP